MSTDRPPIPINIIAGPLGVGKTTTINHLMSQKPADEKWAILVNEYGLVGLDAALMETSSEGGVPQGVDIKEVAGGCICCSAGLMFEVSLVMLLQRKPDRLLIEPTGLAALSGILDTLDRPGIRESVDIRSVICILDPSRYLDDLEREEVRDQVEAADVLLAGRADLAPPEALEKFTDWAKGLYPPKTHIGPAIQGRISVDLLDAISERSGVVRRGGHAHGTDHAHHDHDHRGHDRHDHHGHEHHDHHGHEHHDHHGHEHHDHHGHEHHDHHGHEHHDHHGHEHHDHHGHEHHDHHGHKHHDHHGHEHHSHAELPELVCDATTPFIERSHRSPVASTIGWVCWHDLIFDADSVSSWLTEVSQLPGARRTKAVMRTDQGWLGFNIAQGVREVRPTGYRRDSRLEVIIEDAQYPNTRVLESRLRECLIDTP